MWFDRKNILQPESQIFDLVNHLTCTDEGNLKKGNKSKEEIKQESRIVF